MIHVNRETVKPPSILLSKKVASAKLNIQEEVRQAKGQVEILFDSTIYSNEQVVEALIRLFHQKCAFCESLLEKEMGVEHYRPILRAINLKGNVDIFHYYWLAYEWNNLYLCCSACKQSKGSRFPIKNERAKLGETVEFEETLLIDPCHDQPSTHLVFLESGSVASSFENGKVTIEVFSLNRPALKQERLEVFKRFQASFQIFQKDQMGKGNTYPLLNNPDIFEFFADFTSDESPFAGMCRQFLSEWTSTSPGDSQNQIPMTKSIRQKAQKSYNQYQQSNVAFSLEDDKDLEGYYLRERTIEKIELRNYKIIQNLTIVPPEEKAGAGSWMMILGENGVGKSSILQAVALTLVGDTYRKRLPISPEQVLRRGSANGYVKVHISGFPEPVRLDFSRDSDQFSTNMPDPKVPLLAYGATRLLPRPGYDELMGTRAAHVDNLFNPFIPLTDASKTLAKLFKDDLTRFDAVARALKKLLLLGRNDELLPDELNPEKFLAKINGTTVPLDLMSDGYQTVLALAVDIIATLLKSWDSMEIAEGIVLIDEIGSHLHPYWQMRVIDRLREALPRVQFIISTHYPLCLRGMKNNEVIILRRSKENRNKIVMLNQDLPPVEAMRVDQILTSEFFGLDSAIDPELDKLFKEYYALIARRELNPRQQKRMDDLKTKLDQYKVFGDTPRERMQLEAIDQYLATEDQKNNPEERKKFRQETIDLVADLWAGKNIQGNQS